MVVIGERYHLVAQLGQGGMGAVYDAIHAGTGRRVAVKVLRHDSATSERARTRFAREARLAGGLASAHVAEVLDAGTDEASGLPYIAMEFLEGVDLRRTIARRGKLPPGLVLVIAAHVCSGLAAAHEAEVIHRDVKPANVVLCRDRDGMMVAKLVDFGVAKAPTDDETLTETGAIVGSLPYMSPEQLRGEELDARTDLWSLGILMYEALAGERPTGSAEGIHEIVLQACVRGIPPLATAAPEVSLSIAAVVDRALRVDREDRFASAREMRDAITALLVDGTRVSGDVLEDGADIGVRPDDAATERSFLPVAVAEARVDQPPAPRRGLLIAAALLVASCAGIGILLVTTGNRAPAEAAGPALESSPPMSAETASPSAAAAVASPVEPAADPAVGSASAKASPHLRGPKVGTKARGRAGSTAPSSQAPPNPLEYQ